MIELSKNQPDYILEIEDHEALLYLFIIKGSSAGNAFRGILTQKLGKLGNTMTEETMFTGHLFFTQLSFTIVAFTLYLDLDQAECSFDIPTENWQEVTGTCATKDTFGDESKVYNCTLKRC